MSFIKFYFDSDGFVYIDVIEKEMEGRLEEAAQGLPHETKKSFESAIESLSPITKAIISKITSIDNPPNEAIVEFGLTLRADAGVVITRVGTEANFKVILKWTRIKEDR